MVKAGVDDFIKYPQKDFIIMAQDITDDTQLKDVTGFGGIVGPKIPLIPSEKYEFVFEYYETSKLLGGRALKLTLWFKVITPGKSFELVIPRYYNVLRIIGKPGKNGNFKVGWNSNFTREFSDLFGAPSRPDRMPMSNFKNKIIVGETRVVSIGYQQRKIHKELRYSVIKRLLKVIS